MIPLLFRAAEMQARFVEYHPVFVFDPFPAGDRWLFAYHAGGIVRNSLWFAVDCAAAYAALALGAGLTLQHLAMLAIAVPLAWLSALGAAALLVWWIPRAPFGPIAGMWGLTIFGTIAWLKEQPQRMAAFFDAAASPLSVISPAGWLHRAMIGVFENDAAAAATWALPCLALAGALPWLRHLVLKQYRYRDHAVDWSVSAICDDDLDPEDPVNERATAIGVPEGIRDGSWRALGRDFVKQDAIGRLVVRFLSGRERMVLDFLLAAQPGWAVMFRRALGCSAGGMCVLAIMRSLWPPGLTVSTVFFVWLSLAFAAPLFGGSWPAFDERMTALRRVAIHSLWPVDFRELSRVMLKANAVRLILALPVVVSWGAFCGWLFEHGVASGALFGLKTGLLLLAAEPLFIVAKFSAASNDTSGGCFWKLVVVAGFAAGLFVFGGLGYLALSQPWSGFVFIAAIALLSWALAACYRRWRDGGGFDLLADPGR